ncbi:MAG: lytic transglycosylase domain-containing protein [Chrysiogenales bacterium]
MFKLKKNVSLSGLLLFLVASWHPDLFAVEVPFPQYAEITANVNFWIKMYSLYTTSQAVVHDSVDLNIIYEVIDVKPFDAPGARTINHKSMKKVMVKYQTILRKLASGQKSANAAEGQRVAALFGDKVERDVYSRAAENIRFQIGQKDRFMAGLIRSGAYIDQIREIFKANGLPEDIAYLPHVESSFNVKAYSKFGAAGMWQFTRATGRRFMEVGYALDERRDPIRATHAAARLLKENYAKLGDWPLALTAYNHGPGGMGRAKKIHGAYPQIFTSYRSRIFKFASRNFYSEFLAARQVAQNYKNYFGAIALDQPKPLHTVALDGYCSLHDLSSHFGVFPETLIELNPALRPPVFAGQKLIPKGYSLNLPLLANDGRTPI